MRLTVQFMMMFCSPRVVSRENTGVPLHSTLEEEKTEAGSNDGMGAVMMEQGL